MNRSEFDRYERDAREEERRSLQVLGALVAVLLAGILGVSVANWAEAGSQQLTQRVCK